MTRAAALALVGLVGFGAQPSPAGQAEPIQAITAPSVDLTLSLTRAGKLARVLVRPGQKVKAGELLAQLDDSVEQKQVAVLKTQADANTTVRAAATRYQQALTVLARVQKAFDNDAAPSRELEDARLEAALAELDLAAARVKQQVDVGKYEQASLDLERMRLASPADGVVEKVLAEAGESVDALAPVLRLVNVDPLWIDAPVPLSIGRRIRAGSKAMVALPGRGQPVEAKVIHVSRVADPASETLEVRIELSNPSARFAGEHVTVTFPLNTEGAASDRKE